MAMAEGGVRQEYQCPVCRVGGFDAMQEAAAHWGETLGGNERHGREEGQAHAQGPGGQADGEERESSVVSTDTTMLVVEELKTMQKQQE